MENIENTFNGSTSFGRKITCTIARNGDLVQRMYVRVQLPDVVIASAGTEFRWLDFIGLRLMKSVEIEIGGSRIDKHYANWMHIWAELTQKGDKFQAYKELVGQVPDLTTITKAPTNNHKVVGKELWIPLEFWFCRNPGLALPLIALQYHEVKINIEIEERDRCFWCSAGPTGVTINDVNIALFVDYYFLDNDERRRFAQSAHEYLIDQLQFTGDESYTGTKPKIRMNFNHPVKELVWVVMKDRHISSDSDLYKGPQWTNYADNFDQRQRLLSTIMTTDANIGMSTDASKLSALYVQSLLSPNTNGVMGVNPVELCKIQLNGHDRFSERSGVYFGVLQPWAHHDTNVENGINVFSFAIKPEDYQPSGTCNMSRIDTATMNLTLNRNYTSADTTTTKVYAVNYNVLRIMSGMGGLAYAN